MPSESLRSDRPETASEREFALYLAAVLHELRNPINGILGTAQLMAEVPLDGECAENLRLLRETAEGMELLLNDLMDFACIKAGVFRIEPNPFSIRLTLESVWRALLPQAKEKGISLIVKTSADVPEILVADQGRIRQVVLNLANNAVKFTSRGGVTVTAEYQPTPSKGGRLLVTVKDSGIGIPSRCLEEVFQPFVRGAETDGSTTGHGLGLFVVGRLVTAMGGTILMNSAEGQGTAVTVNIPCRIRTEG